MDISQFWLKILFCSICIACCTFHAIAQTPITISISGVVREEISNESAIGVSVLIVRDTVNVTAQSILQGTRTNSFGFYSLPNLAVNTSKPLFLLVRGIGYRTNIQRLVLNDTLQITSTLRINIALKTQSTRTQSVTVEANKGSRETIEHISRIDIAPEFIKQLPSFSGEKDVFRALQLLPGVKAASELSSGLYIRGGSPEQNLTLLDGAVVYNPSHLGGFFSTFNADALQNISLLKGAFPAQYGGRLASVIDLTMREGTKERLRGEASIGSLSSRGVIEGPLFSSSATFMFSARRTYFDLTTKLNALLMGNDNTSLPSYYFYDLNGKVNMQLSDNDRVFLSGYLGRDVFGFDIANLLSIGLEWGNATGNLRWMHIVSPNLFTNFSAIYTKYDYTTLLSSRFGRDTVNFSTLSQIQDWTIRGEAEYTPNSDHSMKFGIEAIHHTFLTNFGVKNSSIPTNSTPNDQISSIESALYANDVWTLSPHFIANLGLRVSWFQASGQLNAEPRLSCAYTFEDNDSFSNTALKASFSVVNQYMHLVSRSDVSLPSDVWFPSTKTIPAANAVQYTLGAETTLFNGELFASVEGYYKSMRNLYEYRLDANFTRAGDLSESLTRGNGESYGVEVFLNKRIGAVTGWIGYTLSSTTRTFPDLNGGKPFFPRYDRRHDLSIVLTYKINKDWDVSATWVYGTGQAITMPSAQYDIPSLNDPSAQINKITPNFNFSERNAVRMPPFHKLDIAATYQTWFYGIPCEYSISIYNVYNRQNPFTWFVTTTPTTGIGTAVREIANRPVIQQLSLFPILPSVGMTLKF
jgi:TonB-dependent Receptor Plug Domain